MLCRSEVAVNLDGATAVAEEELDSANIFFMIIDHSLHDSIHRNWEFGTLTSVHLI